MNTKILFVCRGNMFRSQVAEVLFNNVKDDATEARSCGTWVEREDLTGKKLKDFDGINEPMNLVNLIEVMKEKDFDISENTCKPITPALVNWADKIISMAEENESPDYLLNSPKITFWEVENPNNFTKEKAREVTEKIEKLIPTI
jgi:protein-tyrosine-phosphatase